MEEARAQVRNMREQLAEFTQREAVAPEPPPVVIREVGDAQLAKFPVERQAEVRNALRTAEDITHTRAFHLFEASYW